MKRKIGKEEEEVRQDGAKGMKGEERKRRKKTNAR